MPEILSEDVNFLKIGSISCRAAEERGELEINSLGKIKNLKYPCKTYKDIYNQP